MAVIYHNGIHLMAGLNWEPCLCSGNVPRFGLQTLSANFDLTPETLHHFLTHLSGLLPVQKDLLDTTANPELAEWQGTHIATISPKLIIEMLRTLVRAKTGGILYRSEIDMAYKAEAAIQVLNTEYLTTFCEAATGFTLFKQNHKRALASYLTNESNRSIYQWIEAFPDRFFENIFALFNWRWQHLNECPEEVGQKIISIVFSRLQHDAYEELLTKMPKRKYSKNHLPGTSMPTEKLLEHLISVSNVIKLSKNSVDIFFQLLNQLEPVRHQYLVIPIKKKKQDIPKDILPICELIKTAL